MKRMRLTMALAMMLSMAALPTMARASMVGTAEVTVGYMKSSNDLTTDGESLGGGIGFGASYWRSMGPMLSWGAEVSIDNLGSVDATYLDPFTLETVNEEVSAKTVRINPGIRLGLGTMVGPSAFVQGTAGLYSISSKYHYQDTSGASFDADDSSSEFGFNVGAGVGIPVGPKTRMNIQGQYHSVATEGENLNYLAVRAGIGFTL